MRSRVPLEMPDLLTGLLVTVLVTVTNCEEFRRSNGLLLTLLILQLGLAARAAVILDRKSIYVVIGQSRTTGRVSSLTATRFRRVWSGTLPKGMGFNLVALVLSSRAPRKRMSSPKRQLAYLQHLLENLPDSTPYHDVNSSCYSFFVSSDEIEEYGDGTSTINHRLEVDVGTCHTTNEIVTIKERGLGIFG